MIAVIGLSPMQGFGSSTYSDYTVDSYSTVHGYGVTDVTNYTYSHTAYASTTLKSPSGRTAYSNVSARNYVRADAYLPFVTSGGTNDTGDWEVDTIHNGYCPVMGHIVNNVGSTTGKIWIGTGHTTYVGKSNGTNCVYNSYCQGMTASCDQSPLIGTLPCKNGYDIINYIYAVKSGIKHCFPIGLGYVSATPAGCS